MPLKEVLIDPMNSGWSINEALFQVEDPYLTLPLPMLATYQAISNAGIKVTLDGHGADELFTGYGHLQYAFKSSNPNETAELISIIKSLDDGVYSPINDNIKMVYIKKKIIEYLKSYLRKPRNFVNNLFSKNDWEFIKYKLEYDDQFHDQFKMLDPLSKSLYEVFHVTVLPTLLRNYDRYSMANGVEIRMPFMDHRLVTYTFSLPWTSKVGGTYSKRIMRDALKDILPEPIRTRRDKIGWNAPMHEWLQGLLKSEIDELIVKGELSKKANDAWQQFQRKVNPNWSDGQKIWSVLMPELWKRAIISNSIYK